LKGKIKFPRNFDKDAKSLIKHLLVADLSKRYGNLKNGAEDIKNHRWYGEIDWKQMEAKKLPIPYKPTVKYHFHYYYLDRLVILQTFHHIQNQTLNLLH
jgi:protein kinase A